jgi:hypothetical protein
MTVLNDVATNGGDTVTPHWFHRRESIIAYLLVLFAVAFNLYHLYPEVAGDVLAWNDTVFHLLAIEAAVEAIDQGQNFTDPWQGSMGMGFPLFHYYQHLPHVTIALFHVITLGIFPLADLLNWTNYLLLSLFPLSIYWSLRRFGFDRPSAGMGSVVASLVATSGIGGLSFASYIFRGWGVHTQVWAMMLLPPALALGYQVLREGKGYFWAALLLAATLISHLIYGYMAFLTLGVLALIQPLESANPKALLQTILLRWSRLILLLLLVVAVTSYFLVPFFLDRSYLNNSVFHHITRHDSYGISAVLRGLAVGHLFDFGRLPALTYLAALGFGICLFRWRNERYLIPVAIFLMWLMLYFGRATWGGLMDLLPLSREIHMNRFVGGVHLGGIFLIAVALATPLRWALSRSNVWYAVAALALVFLVLLPVFGERRSYLAENALSIDKGRQALIAEDEDLAALYARLNQLPPGRVYAGHARGFVLDHWSDHYLVGGIKVYHLLHGQGLDMVGKVYHSYSLNSDVLINFDEQRWDHYNLYNARYVVAPEGQIFPEFVRLLQQFGRHRLYQVDTTGYFDLVGSDLTFAGETPDLYLAASTWLGSRMPVAKKHPVVTFGDPSQGESPLTSAIDLIPEMDPPAGPPRGTVISEDVGGDYFAADVNVKRDSMLLLKATYHPNWRATVDGVKTDTVMLMPSFVGVRLPPGDHNVRIEYRPRRLRMILLVLGLLTLPMIWLGEKRGAAISSRFAPGASARLSGAFRWPKNPGGRQSRRDRRRH